MINQFNNFKSKILTKETLEKFGYNPELLTKGSGKKIICNCKDCNLPVEIIMANFTKRGYACHRECYMKNNSTNSPFHNPETRKKAKQTIINKFGCEFASQNKEIANKISKTKLTEESRNKTKETNLEKYGNESVFQNNNIKEKIKQTNVKNLGVEYPQQNQEVRIKTKQTNLDKYGFVFPTQNQEIKNKTINTNIEKYGFSNPNQNKEIKEKTKKTNLHKYGHKHPMSLFSFRENTVKARWGDIENNIDIKGTLEKEEFWNFIKEGKTLIDICKFYNTNYKSMHYRIMNTEEYKTKFNNYYSYPKQQKQNYLFNLIKNIVPNEDVIINDRKTIYPLELDIYIPKFNLAIEFNGSYWHSEARLLTEEAKNKHYNKTKLCKEKGIRLIHLFEHTFETKEKQILNLIKSSLNCNSIKIGARKCKTNNNIAYEFMNRNHIQGGSIKTIKYFNLEFNNNIVASMSVAKHHRDNNCKSIILNRFCIEDGHNIQGGASKLFNKLITWAKENNYNSIISWSDNIYTYGDIYKTLGFNLIKESSPDYFYYDSLERKYLSKQSQKKSNVKCPLEITERDFAESNGKFRIWDSGKCTWEYKIK